MDNPNSIKTIKEWYSSNLVPPEPGIYAFWWTGNKNELLNAKRNMILSGPQKRDVHIQLEDWWPEYLYYPCLYVGKTTNLKNRFSQHILNGTIENIHNVGSDGRKKKPKTTSCQLRYGIEHIFRNKRYPLEIIHNKVGFSFETDFLNNPTVERFYREDLLIGTWRPWFNIDSER